MNEKVIIQEESRIPKKVVKVWILCMILAVVALLVALAVYEWSGKLLFDIDDDYFYNRYSYEQARELIHEEYLKHEKVYNMSVCILIIAITLAVASIILFFFAIAAGNQIVVTDKRVYGVAAFGKRVDLPMDSISVVGTKGRRRIVIASSSGKIRFAGLKKRDEVHNAISTLLIQRQQMRVANTSPIQMPSTSGAEEIKSYKELLDQGMITQEDFELKKKQILGL